MAGKRPIFDLSHFKELLGTELRSFGEDSLTEANEGLDATRRTAARLDAQAEQRTVESSETVQRVRENTQIDIDIQNEAHTLAKNFNDARMELGMEQIDWNLVNAEQIREEHAFVQEQLARERQNITRAQEEYNNANQVLQDKKDGFFSGIADLLTGRSYNAELKRNSAAQSLQMSSQRQAMLRSVQAGLPAVAQAFAELPNADIAAQQRLTLQAETELANITDKSQRSAQITALLKDQYSMETHEIGNILTLANRAESRGGSFMQSLQLGLQAQGLLLQYRSLYGSGQEDPNQEARNRLIEQVKESVNAVNERYGTSIDGENFALGMMGEAGFQQYYADMNPYYGAITDHLKRKNSGELWNSQASLQSMAPVMVQEMLEAVFSGALTIEDNPTGSALYQAASDLVSEAQAEAIPGMGEPIDFGSYVSDPLNVPKIKERARQILAEFDRNPAVIASQLGMGNNATSLRTPDPHNNPAGTNNPRAANAAADAFEATLEGIFSTPETGVNDYTLATDKAIEAWVSNIGLQEGVESLREQGASDTEIKSAVAARLTESFEEFATSFSNMFQSNANTLNQQWGGNIQEWNIAGRGRFGVGTKNYNLMEPVEVNEYLLSRVPMLTENFTRGLPAGSRIRSPQTGPATDQRNPWREENTRQLDPNQPVRIPGFN